MSLHVIQFNNRDGRFDSLCQRLSNYNCTIFSDNQPDKQKIFLVFETTKDLEAFKRHFWDDKYNANCIMCCMPREYLGEKYPTGITCIGCYTNLIRNANKIQDFPEQVSTNFKQEKLWESEILIDKSSSNVRRSARIAAQSLHKK